MTDETRSVSDDDITTRVNLRQRTGTGAIAQPAPARAVGGGPGGGQARFPEKPVEPTKTAKSGG